MIRDMLTYKRPAGSAGERAFIKRYIDVLPSVQNDSVGNRYLTIGAHPTTLFSCHTDTKHTRSGRQNLFDFGGLVTLAKPANGDVLGADNAAGVYVLLRLIAARIPGLYVFHRAEEIGGLGSSYIAQKQLGMLSGIDRAIAFDRRGQKDIITHQMMGRCCSDIFAETLADEVGMLHEPCPFGTFTDTANYTDLVPECTNVAVGYMLEHTSKESLDVSYLETLIDNILRVDFESLPVARDPRTYEDWAKEVNIWDTWQRI